MLLLAMSATWVGFLGDLWWFFDLFAHFRLQYLALCLVALAWFVWRRSGMGMVSAALGLVVNGVLVFGLPVETARRPEIAPGFRLRVASINVHTSNRNAEKVLDYINQAEADVVLLLEVDEWWAKALSPLTETYPHHLIESREDNFGVAFFARQADARSRIEYFGTLGLPSIVADLSHHGKSIRLIGTHPIPPMTASNSAFHAAQLGEIADFVRSSEVPVLVAGDFNATPWSSGMRKLLGGGLMSLPDARHVWSPSWMVRWPMAIAIDHAVAVAPLAILSRTVGSDIGSDHRPILVECGWAP